MKAISKVLFIFLVSGAAGQQCTEYCSDLAGSLYSLGTLANPCYGYVSTEFTGQNAGFCNFANAPNNRCIVQPGGANWTLIKALNIYLGPDSSGFEQYTGALCQPSTCLSGYHFEVAAGGQGNVCVATPSPPPSQFQPPPLPPPPPSPLPPPPPPPSPPANQCVEYCVAGNGTLSPPLHTYTGLCQVGFGSPEHCTATNAGACPFSGANVAGGFLENQYLGIGLYQAGFASGVVCVPQSCAQGYIYSSGAGAGAGACVLNAPPPPLFPPPPSPPPPILTCPVNRYNLGGVCTTCSTCAAGTYSTSACTPTSNTVCGACPALEFCLGGVATACTVCNINASAVHQSNYGVPGKSCLATRDTSCISPTAFHSETKMITNAAIELQSFVPLSAQYNALLTIIHQLQDAYNVTSDTPLPS